MKGHMQDGKFHPHTDYKGVRKSRDQKVKTQGMKIRKQRSAMFNMNDRVITTEQCFEDVLKGDKGKIIGFDTPRDLIVVEFDLHRGQKFFVPPSCIRQIERKARDEQDSGEIPPEEIYDSNTLSILDGRFFLVAEGYPDTLAVDEYTKVSPNLFKHKSTVYFAQSSEESEETLRTVGGGGVSKHSGVYGLRDEMEFLRGLDRAGGLDG